MDKPKIAEIKRIVGAVKRSSQKVITLDRLSHLVGLYPDVLSDLLVYFDPMIKFDPSINIRNFLPAMEQYIAPAMPKDATPKEKRVVVTKRELSEYTGIPDFVIKKMTSIGGLVDPTVTFSDEDLKVLAKLVAAEIAKRKRKAKKKHRK
jgi:predicted transcriptional regulator